MAGAPEPAGEGVAGTAVAVLDDCCGAAGGAGVEAAAGAGVEGAFDEDAAAGVALGCRVLEVTTAITELTHVPFGPCRR